MQRVVGIRGIEWKTSEIEVRGMHKLISKLLVGCRFDKGVEVSSSMEWHEIFAEADIFDPDALQSH